MGSHDITEGMSHTQQVLKLTWGQKYVAQAVDMCVAESPGPWEWHQFLPSRNFNN